MKKKNSSFQGNTPNFLRQHKDMKFWKWGPTTILHYCMSVTFLICQNHCTPLPTPNMMPLRPLDCSKIDIAGAQSASQRVFTSITGKSHWFPYSSRIFDFIEGGRVNSEHQQQYSGSIIVLRLKQLLNENLHN